MLFRRAAVLLSALLACASASPLHRPSPPTISTDPSANPANLKIFEIFASSVAKIRREGGFVHGEVALARRDGPDDGGLPWTVVVKGGVASGERVAKVPLGLWITPRTVVDSELGAWLSDHFPALLQMPAIVGEVYALYVMWCYAGAASPRDGSAGNSAAAGCGAHKDLIDMLFSLEVPGSPLAVPEHRLRTLLEYHTALEGVVDHDRSLHDSVWAEIEAHVIPAGGDALAGVAEMGKPVFDRVTAVARAMAQPVDPSSRTPVEGIAPVIGLMRHGVATAVDDAGRKLADKVRAFRTVHFEGARIVDAEFGLSAGDEVLLDRGNLRPDQFLTQYGHVPSDAAIRSSVSLEPIFTGEKPDIIEAKKRAYAGLFGGRMEPVTLDLSGRLGLAARTFYRLESCESVDDVAKVIDLIRHSESSSSSSSSPSSQEDGAAALEATDAKMREKIRHSIRAALRLRPNVDFDAELVYERDLLTTAEREIIRVRSAENAVLLATLRASLEEGQSLPPKLWWDQHSATPAVRFTTTEE